MCGRYSITTPAEALRRLFGFEGPLPNLPPRYNVAPRQEVPAVRLDGEGRQRRLVTLRWGLVPFWATDEGIGDRMINARSEGAAGKPAFRAALRSRRCLIPADGFYEWRAEGRRKQPYRAVLADGAPFAFAGLWERWPGPKDGPPREPALETCTILTTDANALLAPIHARMPVILDPADHEAWLDAEAVPPERAQAMLRPFPAERMRMFPVGLAVNNARHDEADCIEPLEEVQPRLL